jgi:acyl-coenzyme A synthetase/AMP-(fatty) acid ligase
MSNSSVAMNVSAAIHMHARLRPRASAVITPRCTLNFAQLDAAIWRGAAHFRAQGLAAGQVVMLDIRDSVRHLVGALALARIGVAHFSKSSQEDAASMAPILARLRAVRTVTQEEVQEDSIFFGSAQPERAAIAEIAADMMKHGATPWLYVTSSGTTGRAKIMGITHRMNLQRCRRHASGVPVLASDRHLSLSDLAFHSPKRQAVGALEAGGCVAFVDGLKLPESIEFIRRVGVTRITCGPIHLHWLCALAERHEGLLLPELRVLEVLGSAVTEKLRRRVRQQVSGNLYVNYGSSETSAVTVAPPEIAIPDTVGAALPGVQLEVVDAANKPLPFNEVGHIRIRAPGTVEGYFDDAEATAKAFRDGWFFPGDLGMLTEDGQLIFKGRADDMMLCDGINIYPAEIEAALGAHEAVDEVAALALKSEVHHHVPVAAVALRAPVAEADLLAYCRSRLGLRAPRRIVIVEAFPRNPAGKILKRELGEVLARRTAVEQGAGETEAPAA